MKEMKANEMTMKGFDIETVTSFLHYIYATEDTRSVRVTEDQRVSAAKDYNRNRLTTLLLRLADMYEAKSLLAACVDHLKRNLSFDNAVDVWKTADELNIEELKLSATYANIANQAKLEGHQVLTCGYCKKTTEKPKLKCGNC